jgi:hypothetical protein
MLETNAGNQAPQGREVCMNPIVNILIVTDDGPLNGGFLKWADQAAADRKGANTRAFHLGEFVHVLSDTSWLGFDVKLTKAHRTQPGNGLTEAQLKADRGADVVGFRFNQPFQVGGSSKTLSDYDMVLFFPIADFVTDAPASLQQEAEAIAQYMESGGGFFATGDHEDLGAPLAKLIPRVRSMRRWYFAGTNVPGPNGEPPAPSGTDVDRHDTTQAGPDHVIQFEDQSDEIAQPIKPAWFNGWLGVRGGYPAIFRLPHPLLCSPDGAVTWLPDHMHEGWCEVPSNLNTTFTVGGSSFPEYPPLGPNPLEPVVVATGDVIGGHTTPAIDQIDHFDDEIPTSAATFGVIGAWDGHRVGKGRVVVDSTWHHFFNINLTGDLYLEGLLPPGDQRLRGFYVSDGHGNFVPSDQYKMIQWYYRNIVYWLIPANRYATIWWTTLARLARTPHLAEELTTSRVHKLLPQTGQAHAAVGGPNLGMIDLLNLIRFGQLAEAYLKKARGACAVADVRVILYKPKIPWWEWVEDIVDPWRPVRDPQEAPAERLHRLAGLGLAPRVEALLKAGLGAALLAAAQTSRASPRENPDALARRADAIWTGALHSVTEAFRTQLKAGVDLTAQLDRALSAPRHS